MDKQTAQRVLDRLHQVQNRIHQGGDLPELGEVLCHDIAWHVPGNAIVGDYHGRELVVDYMSRRRDLAAATMRMHPATCSSARAIGSRSSRREAPS